MDFGPVQGEALRQVLTNSHRIWGEGLSIDSYVKWHLALRRTPWGERCFDFVGLFGPNRLPLCSAKRYDLALRLDGRIRRAIGIGAIMTHEGYRGRGLATELVTRLLDVAETEGFEFAMLFSEIAPTIYERLDFVPVPLMEWRLEVDQKRGGAPAMLVRSGDDRDLHSIVEMAAARSKNARLALDRSEEFVSFGITKKRLLSGLGPSGLRTTEFLVVEEGHQAVAYLVCTAQDGRWMIEDAGDRDPAGARLGAMLQVMLARNPSERLPEIRAWWPHALVPPQLRVAASTSTQEVMMIRPLKDRMLPLPPLAAEEVVYWHADYF